MTILRIILLACLAAGTGFSAVTNLVANGAFDSDVDASGAPDGWACSGNRAIVQRLTLDRETDGNRCAKLACSAFAGEGPDHHAMVCQVGRVSLRQGQWYRLTFRARADRMTGGEVDLSLVDMKPWKNVGLSEACMPTAAWQPFAFLFQATEDLPAADSRLQFWFKGTGTLWLDDVKLTEWTEGQQWFPQIATEGVKNLIPNSSFECGTAGWGGMTFGLGGWGGHLCRLEGEWDGAVAQHGGHSLRLTLGPGTTPTYFFDYYEPVRQPLRRTLAANRGWLRVKPGEPLTLSAWLRADAEDVTAQLVVNEAPQSPRRKAVIVGREWKRRAFTFTPSQPFLFVAVGLDLEASRRDAATLWVDAVQLERGAKMTDYGPRQSVEAFLAPVGEPILTNAAPGLAFSLRAFNQGDTAGTVRGRLDVTDFFDRTAVSRGVVLDVPAHAGAETMLGGLCPGRYGFFRATWTTPDATQTVRRAVIAPVGPEATDSPLGFNHAYPWDFLMRLARQAGMVWWRDWSAKWQTVEASRGRFDFAVPDAQIGRVRGLDGQALVLLPFPAAGWSTTARTGEVERAAGKDTYLRVRLPMAFAPANLGDFGRYAAEVARHYGSGPRPVTHVQILNEPIYTSYALPRQFGYALPDYLRLLENASRAVHAAAPTCRVVGGIGAGLDAPLTREFVMQGGLRSADALDIHIYDAARPAEWYEAPFEALGELMRTNGGPKEVWITEWGCYADDDPASVPESVGDATMNRCRWPSERAATEYIVKFTAIAFAHDVRKILFHAGTCGPVNGSDAGGVLFAHGGAPRRMYAGVAVLSRLLGVPDVCTARLHDGGLRAYVFRGAGRAVAIAWSETPRALMLPDGVRACDIMGNALDGRETTVGPSPIYLTAGTPEVLVRAVHPEEAR